MIDEILGIFGYHRDEKLHVYWCLPGKGISDGLVAIDTDADTAEMIRASRFHKNLVLMVDHSNFVRILRDHVIVKGGQSFPAVISPRKVAAPVSSDHGEASSSTLIVEAQKNGTEGWQSADSESESDCDFHDSDCNAEDGDDDLFLDNVDREVNDHNERVQSI